MQKKEVPMKNELEYEKFINLIFSEYLKRKQIENIYLRDIQLFINIIKLYFSKDRKPYFKEIIDRFKELYIMDESRIEENSTLEEQEGLGEVYDYIRDFDFDKDSFNIFVNSMIIHQKLYSKSVGKEFGGKLRTTNASLYKVDFNVPDYNDAIIEFNRYLNSKVSNSIFEHYKENELFLYIEDCIILTTKLIKLQPFQDGNKRTFRALLNLLFKRVNIPPIFIEPSERKEYKAALVKAITEDKYDDIIKFYYYKICDAIILLDIENVKNSKKTL